MFGFDQELSRASLGFEFYFTGAGRFLENAFDLLGELIEYVVIVSVNLHRKLRLCAFEHFVESLLDWLRKNDVGFRAQPLHHLADLGVQLGFVARPAASLRPFLDRFVENKNVALARRHRIGGDVVCAGARKDSCNLRKITAQRLFQLQVDSD